MTPATKRPVVCGARAYLPGRLVPQAVALAAPGTAEAGDVQRHVRCTLQAHAGGLHAGFVMQLDGVDTGSVWTHWTRGTLPAAVVVHPDCPATHPPTREPCCEYAGHPGGHTYEITDPDDLADAVADSAADSGGTDCGGGALPG